MYLESVQSCHAPLGFVRDHPSHRVEEDAAGSTEMVRATLRVHVATQIQVLEILH